MYISSLFSFLLFILGSDYIAQLAGLNYSSNKSACTSFFVLASSSFAFHLLLYVYDCAMLDKAGQQKADCRGLA